jgi:hypothetical protein
MKGYAMYGYKMGRIKIEGFLGQETYRSRHGRLLLDTAAQSAHDAASIRDKT